MPNQNVQSQFASLPPIAGRYRVVRQVGSGGMAQVYRAYDLKLDRYVAVKVLLGRYASNAEFVNRLVIEARSAARLDGRYIVNIYDWGIDGNCCFIVMEYVDGFDLKNILTDGGEFRPLSAARIGMQVCSALAEAHDRGIIHSDVKPANIMMLRNGDVKLADFGIAQARRTDLSGKKGIMGTFRYMSPEQARGAKLTAASDLYSLGVTLYELCTTAFPFGRDTHPEAPGRLIKRPPTPPSRYNPGIGPELEHVILKCLEPDPASRYSTAQRLRADLVNSMNAMGAAGAEMPIQPNATCSWALAFVANGRLTGNAVRLNGPAVIGRHPDADIRLVAPEVSQKHARVRPEGGMLSVEDLDSSNGTLLNGRPIRGRSLCRADDLITIGPTLFCVTRIS